MSSKFTKTKKNHKTQTFGISVPRIYCFKMSLKITFLKCQPFLAVLQYLAKMYLISILKFVKNVKFQFFKRVPFISTPLQCTNTTMVIDYCKIFEKCLSCVNTFFETDKICEIRLTTFISHFENITALFS